MPGLATFAAAPSLAPQTFDLPAGLPDVPDDVMERFPSMQDFQNQMQLWWKQTSDALNEGAGFVADTVNNTYTNTNSLSTVQGNMSARITTEVNARIAADSALASSITTVESIANSKNQLFVQGTAPSSPQLNDLWVDTAAQNQYFFWDGAAWDYKQDQVLAAAISTEATTRADADGFLSGNYALTVIAGNVVTGMTITSSTGSGGTVSNVIFQANSFQVWNGSAGLEMFATSGGLVTLGSTLVVDVPNAKVYIGSGTYGSSSTYFYVDSGHNFSLGSTFLWNGSTLAITGSATFSGTVDVGSGANHFVINGSQAVVGTTGSTSSSYLSLTGSSFDFAVNGRDYVHIFATGPSGFNWTGAIQLYSGSSVGTPTPNIIISGSGSITFGNDINAAILYIGSGTLEIQEHLQVLGKLFLPTPGTSYIQFSSSSVKILENSGLQLWGDVSNPVQVPGSFLAVGQTTAATSLEVVLGSGVSNEMVAVFRKNRGAVTNSGILFQNDFWNDDGSSGMCAIVGVDNGSAGGEMHFRSLPSGSGAAAPPVDQMILYGDGTLGMLHPICKAVAIRDGWTPPLSSGDITGHNFSFQYVGGHFYVLIDATSFMIF
jgi:Domain of unknown function (DUF1983)